MINLDDNYWSGRYRQGATGWDMGQVSPPLKGYFETTRHQQASLLIPGCGNAYEAEWLAQHGYQHITLVDISAELVNQLQRRLSIYPQLRILHQDFFEHQGQYDVIIEQTFFCAIHPSYRPQYVQQMHRLLKNGGLLVGVWFQANFEGGPPYGGSEREYRQLFESHFLVQKMETCYNSIAARQGRELFVVLKKP